MSFVNRNHVAFDVSLMHDFAAGGAHTVSLVGLRLEVFRVLSLNVSRFVV